MPIILSSPFTAPDGTTLASYAPTTGPPWTVNGHWAINSNALSNTAADGDVVAYEDASVADLALSVTYSSPGASWNGAVVFNLEDTNNYWMMDLEPLSSGVSYVLYEKTAGTYHARASNGAGLPTNTTFTLEITTAGDNVVCLSNGLTVFNYTTAARPHKAGTRFGFRRDSAGGLSPNWQNFLAQTPTPTTPNQIIASNPELQREANELRLLLLTQPCYVILYRYQVGLHPGTALGEVTECSWNTYTRKNTLGKWGAVYQVQDGQYSFASAILEWPNPTTAGQTVAGWMLLDPTGSRWIYGEEFSNPYVITGSGVPFAIQITPSFVAWRFLP